MQLWLVLSLLCSLAAGEQKKAEEWKPDELWCPTKRICENGVQPLGCFDQGPSTPWCHMAYPPQSLAKVNPIFWFFKPGSGTKPIRLDFTAALNMDALGLIDPLRELYAVSHGFGGPYPQDWIFPMAEGLTALGHYVLTIDWTGGSQTMNYLQAAADTRLAGAALANVLEHLYRSRGLSPSRTTIVGFSLGAHVAGFAGARIPGLRRIIGLDPAGPLYANRNPFAMGMNPQARLNTSDARLVVCIHTDGPTLIPQGGAGTTQAFGHIDFYANGGMLQPGCSAKVPIPPMGEALEDLLRFNWKAVMNDFDCPHERAHAYLITAVHNMAKGETGCRFDAFPCDSYDDWFGGKCTKCGEQGCLVAGLQTDVDSAQRGKFYFATLPVSKETGAEWCGRQFQLQFTTDAKIKGQLTFEFGGPTWISPPQTFYMDGSDNLFKQRLLVLDYDEAPEYVKVTYAPESWFTSAWSFHFSQLDIHRLGSSSRSYSVPKGLLDTDGLSLLHKSRIYVM